MCNCVDMCVCVCAPVDCSRNWWLGFPQSSRPQKTELNLCHSEPTITNGPVRVQLRPQHLLKDLIAYAQNCF